MTCRPFFLSAAASSPSFRPFALSPPASSPFGFVRLTASERALATVLLALSGTQPMTRDEEAGEPDDDTDEASCEKRGGVSL